MGFSRFGYLSDQVLNDVYQYHLPPVRRIPPLVWTRVRSDLKWYFTERSADGVSVLCWYHHQFARVSRERYLRNVNIMLATHAYLIDYRYFLSDSDPDSELNPDVDLDFDYLTTGTD